jgi:hypothetical protein
LSPLPVNGEGIKGRGKTAVGERFELLLYPYNTDLLTININIIIN